jgi:NitT/TauT family transport system substrate-binding protein
MHTHRNHTTSRASRFVPARLGSTRPRVLASLAALAIVPSLFGLVAAAPAQAALKQINYQLGWVTNTEFAGTYLAQADGAFAAGGIHVNILPGGSDPVEPVVVSGKALVGDSNADTVAAAVAAGAPRQIKRARGP